MYIRSRFPVHLPLVFLVLSIACLGIVNIYSAAHTKFPHLYLYQGLWMCLGLLICFSSLIVDYRVLEKVAYPFYGVLLFLLMMVLFLGKKVYGAKRWINLGFMNLQPSELMKIGMILVLAKYFSQVQQEHKYTIRDLLRPHLITRPLVLLGALLRAWFKNEWLQDPVGSLARHLRSHQREYSFDVLEWDTSYGFRFFLVAVLLLYALALFFLWRQMKQEKILFKHTHPGLFRGAMFVLLMPGVLLMLYLLLYWQSVFLADPMTALFWMLQQKASPSGVYEIFHPRLWLRVGLLVFCVLFFCYALWRLLKDTKVPWRDRILAPIDLVLLPMGLILVQPDLGTALLVGAIAFSMILLVGMRISSVGIMGVMGCVFAYLSWFALLKDYQKKRILTFINPESDALGSGYHAQQSIIAVGSGQWFGKGLHGGTQSKFSYLPESHTDFAFSVWGEEHGFFGCVLLISLFFVLIFMMVSIAASARDRFGALLVTGFSALIFWQAFVNMGMVIGLLPIVGVPLPLFSYGGSSLFSVMIGIGVTLNVAYRRYLF